MFSGSCSHAQGLCQQRYALVGVVYHIGDSLLAGHYRAALAYVPNERSAPSFCATDRGKKPARCKSADYEVISTGCYLLFFVS